MPAVTLREMTIDDINDVLSIEREAYEFPWSKTLLEQAVSSTKYCAILQIDEEIKGYGIISFVAGESELLNLCISPDQQGKGLSYTLLQHLIDYAAHKDNHDMFLEVRVSNAAGIHLYEKVGFNEIGRRKNYYPAKGGKEDAILMALPLFKD